MKSSMFRKIHSHILPFFVAFSIVIIIANLLTGCGTSPGNTDYTYINGSSCTLSFGGTTDTCLAPGESRSFSVIIDVPPSEVTDYYYKINYDISK